MTNSEKITLTITCNRSSGSGYWNVEPNFSAGVTMNYLQ